MAHESFEDKEVANILNKYFVSIKVDREERPDIDQVYMAACQAMNQSCGWPLSIFMTPAGKPFFAGTYFPKQSRMGLPGFVGILTQIEKLWQKDREKLLNAADNITNALVKMPGTTVDGKLPGEKILGKAYDQFSRSFEPKWGGFSSAPKFPTPHNLIFLLRWYKRTKDPHALEMVTKTLDAMRDGGIFDQVGYGFHRYSVDDKWLVPHFEKMLYDQAMLAMAYTDAYLVTGNEKYSRVVQEIFTYVLRDMTSPEGGFYTAEDADSEGKEGLFYLWTPEEVKGHLGEKPAALFCQCFDITATGNFEEGHSIPHRKRDLKIFAKKEGIAFDKLQGELERAREKLFAVRKKRIHPAKDDKILTSWNGLMIAALARGFQATGNHSYLEGAEKAAKFIVRKLKSPEGKLFRRYRDGQKAYSGYLDDYAFMVWGLLELYESTFDVGYLKEAVALNGIMIDQFWDKEEGGFYYTGRDNEALIVRNKDIHDGAIPSGNSVAALNLLRLGRMTGDLNFEKMSHRLMLAFVSEVEVYPMAYTQLLAAIDFMVGPGKEIVIAGKLGSEESKSMLDVLYKRFLPNTVVLFHDSGSNRMKLLQLVPFVRDLKPINQKTTAYVCEQFTCKTPITDAASLKLTLD